MTVTVRLFNNGETQVVPIGNILTIDGQGTGNNRKLVIGSFVDIPAFKIPISADAALQTRRAVVIDCTKSPGANRKKQRGTLIVTQVSVIAVLFCMAINIITFASLNFALELPTRVCSNAYGFAYLSKGRFDHRICTGFLSCSSFITLCKRTSPKEITSWPWPFPFETTALSLTNNS